MKSTIQILLTGHGGDHMETLQSVASQLPGVKIEPRILNGVDYDFLGSSEFKADVLIHFLGTNAEMELKALARQTRQGIPITVIVYDQGMANAQLMRLAMQAGVRDFIMGPQVVDDTLVAVRKILKEDFYERASSERTITAVVNAKGGGGASTIACALAHAFAIREGLRTLLLDLDLQFGTQCWSLGLNSPQSLMQALDSIENLDEIALMGYVAKHASGLHVLHTLDTECILPGEVDLKRLERLIDVINRIYEHMVVDLPHMIDPVFNLILEQADHLVIVMQQDIYSVRDARRMIRIITGELGMPMERIIPVLNRYVHNNAFGLADVEHTLALQPIFVVPNDFNNLSTASNLGIAIADHAPRSPATRAIQKLAANLSGKNNPAKPGAFRLFLSRLIMGDKR